MAAPMFFFDANVSSPQELAKKRAVAQAMMMNFGKARNVGEGAGQLLQGIALGVQNRNWNQAEAAGKASAGSLFSNLFSGGQGAFPPAPPPPPDGGGTVGQTASQPEEAVDYATQRVSQAFGDAPKSPLPPAANDVAGLEGYIRESALQRGIDPDIAVRVAKSEGLAPGVWQSNVVKGGTRETSYGPFQLLVGGGLGDKFMKTTGLDPRDPSTARAQIDFALDEASRGGWGPWYGAAKVGVGRWDGLRGAKATGAQQFPAQISGPGQPMPSSSLPVAAMLFGQAVPETAPVVQAPVPSQSLFVPPPAKNQARQAATQPSVQMAQAQGTLPEMAGNAPSVPRQQAGGPSVEVLMQAMSNPWLDDGQKQVIGAMLEQKLREQDPMRALEMQKAQIELQRLQNPGPEYDMITGRDGSIFRADKRTGSIEQVYGGKPDQPSGVQEYEYYANQERAAGREPAPFGEWKATQSRAGASQVNIDQKTEGAFDKKLAEGQAEIFNTMAQEGLNANADIAIIGQLDGLLGQNGGTLSGLSSMMAKYGIGGEGMSDIQAAQALINKLVPSQRQPGSGTMSDRDVELFTRSLPSLWNTPGGNKIILDTMRGLAEYKRKQGEIAMGVQMGELTRQEAVQALKALPNPLAGFGTNDRPQKKQPTVIDGYTIEEVE